MRPLIRCGDGIQAAVLFPGGVPDQGSSVESESWNTVAERFSRLRSGGPDRSAKLLQVTPGIG
jgi:hypothetical protein